jgi:hypothetical protein
VKNPVPDTVTRVAFGPDAGLSVMVGGSIWNVAETVSNAPPVECAVTL